MWAVLVASARGDAGDAHISRTPRAAALTDVRELWPELVWIYQTRLESNSPAWRRIKYRPFSCLRNRIANHGNSDHLAKHLFMTLP